MAADDLTSLESALRQLISDLRRDCLSFALVGELAVSVRAGLASPAMPMSPCRSPMTRRPRQWSTGW
jgi:hypothetical protein